MLGKRGATVADYLCWRDGSMFWDVHLIRYLQNWEQEEIITFMYLLYSTRIKWDADDQLCWQPSKSSLFEVKVSFGPWSFDYLVYTGLCLRELLMYWHVGKGVLAIGLMEHFGVQILYIYCGWFGRNVTAKLLRV